MNNPKISAVIITLNEERNIARCLESIQNVADEIIVVDSFSTDRTKKICETYNVTFVEKEWMGYSQTKNYGNSLAQYDYILSLDADEALSEKLKASILSMKNTELKDVYEFNRLTNYCGTWIKHCGWYPDKKQRLFRKEIAQWQGDFVHEVMTFNTNSSFQFLEGDLLHYSYYTIAEHEERIEKYALLGAKKLKHLSSTSLFFKSIMSPLFRFIKMYIIQLGFLDGKAGLQVCYYVSKEVQLKYKKAIKL